MEFGLEKMGEPENSLGRKLEDGITDAERSR
jgi:hypothetical protein